MTLNLQTVNDDDLTRITQNPKLINEVSSLSYSTDFYTSISYFITQDAYGLDLLYGTKEIESDAFENGSFSILKHDEIQQLVSILNSINMDEILQQIEEADFEELIDEEELYDLELLGDNEEAKETLQTEIERLQSFYKDVIAAKMHIISYES